MSSLASRLTVLGMLHWHCARSLRRAVWAAWALVLPLGLGLWVQQRQALGVAQEGALSVAVTAPTLHSEAAWPERAQIDALLSDMNRARERLQLQWGPGGLTVRPAASEGAAALGRQDIAMSLVGGYAPLRRMVAELLNAYPSLALTSLEVRRDEVNRTRVQAQLHWVFVHALGAAESMRPALPVRAQVAPAAADPFAVPVVVAAAPRPTPPPPVAVVAPVVVPAPSAPPLPFKFLGRVSGQASEGAAPQAVFLALGKQVLRVQVGDTLAGQYRVDALEEGAVRFTYLPLNERQSLLLK